MCLCMHSLIGESVKYSWYFFIVIAYIAAEDILAEYHCFNTSGSKEVEFYQGLGEEGVAIVFLTSYIPSVSPCDLKLAI